MHHLCLGFTCIALFLYPSCSFAVISLIVFTHNMHTLCYIGYSNWSKNWLINFWAMYFLVYAFFCVNCRIFFFLRDMMDNQCANIFSTWFEFRHHLFMGHIVSSLHLSKEIIFFFMCILNLVFLKTWFVSFYFSPPPKFSPKLFFPKLVLFFLFL